MREQEEESVVVSSVSQVQNMLNRSSGVAISSKIKPRSRKITASMAGFFGGSVGNTGAGAFNPGGTAMGSATNVYSPHLSTDFLELPQTLTEQRSYFRFFYNNDPFVGQAIDLHTELPLSRLRLTLPKGSDPKRNREILKFYEEMVSRTNLLDILIDATREYYVIGEAFVFAEDSEVEVPDYVYLERVNTWDPETGETNTKLERRENADRLIEQYKQNNYNGWDRLILLPPDQVNIETFQYSNRVRVELVPDDKVKNLVQSAIYGDSSAAEALEDVPEEIIEFIANNDNLPLGTDPYEGSFVFQLARKKPPGEDHGVSILQRCLLPGTPVFVERNGILQSVSVELIDPDTDLILTHKGNRKSFNMGSRQVEEDIVDIHIEGQPEPISLTKDHEVFRVLPSGTEEVVRADSLVPGDRVREVSVIPDPEKSLERVDLSDWWRDREISVTKRRHESLRDLRVKNTQTTESTLSVTFSWDRDNVHVVGSLPKRRLLFDWLLSLKEPVTLSYNEVADVLGLTKSEVGYYASLFSEEGILIGSDPKTRKTVWYPQAQDKMPGTHVSRTLESTIHEVPLTDDFMYVVGTWLGDGCVWSSDDAFLDYDRITWTFGDDEEGRELRDILSSILGRLFPAVSLSYEPLYASNECLALHVEDPLFARFIVEEFGKGHEGKRLPAWVFDLSDSKVSSLLGGLIDSDGHVREVKVNPSWSIELKNQTLIEQAHLLLNRLGITTSVKKTHRKADSRHYWRLSCTRARDVYACVEYSPVKRNRLGGYLASPWHKDRQEVITRRVLEVSERPYNGPVYSFGVDDDESHSAGFIAVHNCLRTLVYRDKLRQTQTSIASRAMTPKRLIWAEDMDEYDVEDLREQVDLALLDPDYSIISNFNVNWEEISARDRLLDLRGEYDITNAQLFAGLGVTESMLTGDSHGYAGEKINIEVINTRYMLYRERIQQYVEEHLFKPVAEKKGFVEYDEFNNRMLLYPRLSFTRLALRDNRDTFDAMFNLYQKGSLSVDYILELFNLDPQAVEERLKANLMTVNDAMFNEIIRSAYSEVGREMKDRSDIVERMIRYMNLTYVPPTEDDGGGRW